MQLRQILTGSCNINEQCLSYGSLLSNTFIAYGSGSDIVILNHDFVRKQIIPGCKNKNSQILAVSCTFITGKILVLCNINICIYEPHCKTLESQNHFNNYFWELQTTLEISVKDMKDLCWIPNFTDTFVLVGKCIQVWQLKRVKTFYVPNQNKDNWTCMWNKICPGGKDIDLIKFSFDGKYFATLSLNSSDILLWFWDQYSGTYFSDKSENGFSNDLFDYITIKHPASVISFEWRKFSNYMPKNSINNSLLTCSDDNVCRIWTECYINQYKKYSNKTDYPNSYSNGNKIPDSVKRIFRGCVNQKEWSFGKDFISTPDENECVSMDADYIFAYPEFVLSASINDATDIPLFTSLNPTGKPGKIKLPLTVHWLNNKEYNFNYQIEKCLTYLISNSNERNSENLINDKLSEFNRSLLLAVNKWKKSCDVLFAIHPQNGSLLVWFIHNLDESGGHLFDNKSLVIDKSIHIKNSQVTVHSCLPNCLPAADAISMNSKVLLFCEEMPFKPVNEISYDNIVDLPQNYNVKMISKQQNGSLNMWSLTVSNEENGNTSFLNIKHLSRISGHRWQTNSASCHIQLPFLLTVSNILKRNNNNTSNNNTSELSELILWRIKPIGPFSKSGGITEIARINSDNYLNFTKVAWFPGTVPTYLFGLDISSPASFFIASDFLNKLSLYITIADAKNIIENEIFQNKNADCKELRSPYKIISLTSTGEPGCILSAGILKDSTNDSLDDNEQNFETLLLHVFPKDMIFSDFNDKIEHKYFEVQSEADSDTKYSETFFVVRIMKKKCNDQAILEMWKIQFTDNEKFKQIESVDDLIKIKIDKEKVFTNILKLPNKVVIIKAVPAASHLSSASIYPNCLAPYLITTMCSDGSIRFWKCLAKVINSSYSYEWIEWSMQLQSEYSSAIILKQSDNPLEISCAYSGRVAVGYSDNFNKDGDNILININVDIYECESTGGSEWILEDSIKFSNVNLLSRVKNLNTENNDCSKKFSKSTYNYKDIIQIDWVNSEDGTYLLSISLGTKIMIFSPACLDNCKYSRFSSETSSLANFTHWMKIDEIPLQTADSLPPLPVHISWAREGILIVGMDNEVHVYNQWNFLTNKHQYSNNFQDGPSDSINHKDVNKFIKCPPKANYSMARLRDAYICNSNFKRSFSKTHLKSVDVEDETESSDEILQNAGLFEAAQIQNPVLPQYHPKQLMEWINFGKIKRVKAILTHLTNCISSDDLKNSLTMKIIEIEKYEQLNESLAEMSQLEIKAIPPLPLHILLKIDSDVPKISSEKTQNLSFSNDENDLVEINYIDKDESDVPQSQQKSEYGNTPWLISCNNELSGFGSEGAQRLSNCLTRVQLPGLSALDQIYLLGIAELMANLKTDISDQMNFSKKDNCNIGEQQISTNSMDDCGIRFLLAIQHFSYMIRTLPMNQRNNLLIQGIDTSCLIWGFHSETEDELCLRLDEITSHNMLWIDFRRYGCGWWIRNNNILQKMIEKVAKNTFQKSKNPMDSAIFYLAMGKQKLLAKLFKNSNQTELFTFFNLDFSKSENKDRALNQAYKMRSKRRYDHAVALFLLCHSIEDAILICLHNLKDMQLALTISRLYDSSISYSTQYFHSIVRNHVIKCQDPFIRSMGYWMLEEYINSLDSLLSEPSKTTDFVDKTVLNSADSMFNSTDSVVFVFFNFLKRHPIITRQKIVYNKNNINGNTNGITPMERRLYFRTAYTYLKMGCPDLALEVLSKLPERIVDEKNEMNSEKSKKNERCEEKDIFDFSLDFSPILDNMSFKVQWDNEEEADYQNEKNIDDSPSSVLDIMCLQYKFMICLKLISEELCTLATGIESHGSYLRYHLYTWLEKEVQVLQSMCRTSNENDIHGKVKLIFDENCNISIKERISLRKRWLKANQSLLISLYSFCSLHGPNIVGLAAISMELLILLQDIQGNSCIQYDHCVDVHSSVNLPFINSSLSPDNGLIITPIQQLKTFISEIIDCIDYFKCPFPFLYHHTINCINKSDHEIDENKSKIKLLRNQCQALSACLHQCLSNFTGIKNSENFNYNNKRRPRQSSTSVIYSPESDIQLRSKYFSQSNLKEQNGPNSDPMKWPGYTNLFKVFGCKPKKDFTNFSYILAEALVTVYIGILIYALHLNDSNLLYRLTSTCFNKKLWGKIFGGTYRQKPNRPSGPPSSSTTNIKDQSQVKKENQNQTNLVSPSIPRNRLYSRLSPPISSKTQPIEEKFIPPLHSILTTLLEKPIIDSNSPGFIYDSDNEESDKTEDYIDDEEMLHDSEFLNSKSYTWALMKFVILHSVSFEIKNILKILQIENGELAIFCPNIFSIHNCLIRWQNQCKIHLNDYASVPRSYSEFFNDCQTSKIDNVSTRLINMCKQFGNSEISPFKNKSNLSLSMKRLWMNLINKSELQPIFVQHFLFSKNYRSEKNLDQKCDLGNNSEINKCRSIRIIHKEHESLISMAINQVDKSLLATCSSKEIVELSITHLVDSERWFEDDYDYWLNAIKEPEKNPKISSRNSEKCLTSDFLLLSPTFGSQINYPSQDCSSSNVLNNNIKYLSEFSSELAFDMCRKAIKTILKRPMPGIQIIKSHPTLPYYLTGNNSGQVGVFEWGIDAAVVKTYSPIQKGKITSLNFDMNGNKFGMGDSEGNFSLFHFSYADNSRAQYFHTKCPHKGVLDFCFLNSSSLVATSGGSALHGLPSVNQLHSVNSGSFESSNINVSIWDILLPPGRNQVRNLSDSQLSAGVVALCYVSHFELLLAGTRKGEIALIDIRQNKIQNIFQAHDSCITEIKLDPLQYYFVTSASDGSIKIWHLFNQELIETFRSDPIKSSVFSKGDMAIKSLDILDDNKIITCSADGFIKLRYMSLNSLCNGLNGDIVIL